MKGPSAKLSLGLLLLGTAFAASPPRPRPRELQRAVELDQDAVVEVRGPHHRGPGVLVGTDGRVLTSSEWIGGDAGTVRVGDRELPATVVATNPALKVALMAIDGGGNWRPAPVRLDGVLERGAWLIGFRRNGKGQFDPVLGQVSRPPRDASPFLEADLALGPGSPLFDPRGHLVALCIQAWADGCRAVALPAIKDQLSLAGEP
jgi:S1-C subfamily serine protease